MKKLCVSAAVLLCLVSSAFGLSDKEYKQMMKNAEFKQADAALNKAWKEAKSSLDDSAFEDLRMNQVEWVKRGRDDEAKPLLQKMNRTKAYAAVTRARAEYINSYVHGVMDEPEIPDDYDAPGDLPDDLPDDLPTDTPQQTQAQAPSKAGLASREEAEEFLEDKLLEMDKIMPTESLEYLGTVSIGGEECMEFSSLFNFNETGRYAVSPSRKIYEHDGEKYIIVEVH